MEHEEAEVVRALVMVLVCILMACMVSTYSYLGKV